MIRIGFTGVEEEQVVTSGPPFLERMLNTIIAKSEFPRAMTLFILTTWPTASDRDILVSKSTHKLKEGSYSQSGVDMIPTLPVKFQLSGLSFSTDQDRE